MVEFDATEFLDSLSLEEGAEAVDKAFAALSAKLSGAEYKAAVDAIEKNFLTTRVDDFRVGIKEIGVGELKKQIRQEVKEAEGDESVIPTAQGMAQVMLHISKTKGDEASPLVKAFVRAAEKLTDREYNSVQCASKPLLAVIDAIAEGQAVTKHSKPNPFRQNPPRTAP